MIALDFQPFSVVDDRGFRSLLNVLEPRYILPSRRYITDTVLPQIHKGIVSKVEAELSLTNVESFSFTTDIWSSEISDDSMISLTAHWITDAFIRKSAVLHVQSFPDSHTGANICAMFDDMFERWKIKKENIHIIVSDNASNMVKAMKDGGYLNLGCFAHTLQLIVNDGVLTQRSVVDTLAICRRIVGHFKRSSLACVKLQKIQVNLGIPEHKLKQDIPTRWNSTLYMLKSVEERHLLPTLQNMTSPS